MSWVRIRELVRKEFIVLFRDKRNRPVLIVAPLIQLMVFGYVVNYDIKDIRVALIDSARTTESRELARQIEGNPTFRITRYPHDQAELEDLLLRGQVDIGVKIAPDMSGRIRAGETAAVQVLADGSMSNMAAVRISYTLMVFDRYNQRLLRELFPYHMDVGRLDARIRTWYNPNSDSQFFFVPGIVAFIVMLLSLLLTSIAIIRERETGTMEQLIVTPLKPFELILGKTIPYIIISIVQMMVVIAIAKLWFKIPIAGNPLVMFAGTCVFLLSTLGVGLFISTVSATQPQAMMTTFFFVMPFFMLSGFAFPIANMPTVVQWLTYLNPLRYFLIIIRGVFLKGVGFHVLWPQFLGLGVLGVVLFTGATLRFHKRLD